MEPLRANTARRTHDGPRSAGQPATPTWARLLPAIGCLLAVGCNNGRQLQTDLYQRELRLQEDEIYRLEDYVEEYQSIIQSYRCEVAELKQELAATRDAAAGPTLASPADSRRAAPQSEEPSLLEVPEPVDLEPSIEMPESLPSPGSEAPAFDPGGDETSLDAAPPFEGAWVESYAEPQFVHADEDWVEELAEPASAATAIEATESQASQAREPAPLRQASDAAHIQVAETAASVRATPAPMNGPPNPYPHAKTTASVAPKSFSNPLPPLDDAVIELSAESLAEGEASILAVVRQTAVDSLAGFRGEASVMLTDPSVDGRLRRIARWDFTADEIADAWVQDAAVEDERLELPIGLPAETPTERPLRLWVRLVDASGRKTMQVTEVRFLGGSLQLAPAQGQQGQTASSPRRLPAAGDQAPAALAQESPADPELPSSEEAAERWRRAGEERTRRVDAALQTVSFESVD